MTTKDSQLRDHVAVITGGSKGIGLAIAERLGLAGASVVISSRKEANLSSARDSLRAAGVENVVSFAGNAGNPEDAESCLELAISEFGRLDILVNNAGTNPYFGPLMNLDSARAEKTATVNLFAPVAWTQRAWSLAFRERGGCVINVASVGAFEVDPAIGYYNATKAALVHMTRQLAAELAPGVRVNGIAPGLIKTDMSRALWEPNERELAAKTPLGRLGTAQDVAEAAFFLAGSSSEWITGQTLIVDGGQTIAVRE